MIKLFESSRRYQDNADINYDEAISLINTDLEKRYILDIACMATWGDKIIDLDEQKFLHKLGSDLKLDYQNVIQSILDKMAM